MKRWIGTTMLTVLLLTSTSHFIIAQDDPDQVTDAQIPIGRGFAIGDYNIRIDYTGGDNLALEIIQAIENSSGSGTIGTRAKFQQKRFRERINLRDSTVQLWFGDKGELKWGVRGKAGNEFNPGPKQKNELVYVNLNEKFDAKIIMETQPTGDPAFIGIEDARDNAAHKPNIKNAYVVSLDYKSINRKRLRIWYGKDPDNGKSSIVLDANAETKVNKDVKVDICKYSDPGSDAEPNKMSAKWGNFEYSVREYLQCAP